MYIKKINRDKYMDSYLLIIGFGLMVVLSYLFDILSEKLKIPSVLFLIGTGMALNFADSFLNIGLTQELTKFLELLGIVGMMLIVLEAALDLKLSRRKIPVIRNSFFMALLILVITSLGIAFVIMQLGNSTPFFSSFVYAIPLSVVSSAVLIPSIHSLSKDKKEFMTYEATFSDIMGILFFNFVVLQGGHIFTMQGFWMIVSTVIFSMFFSVFLLWLATKLTAKIKLFLLIALLATLFAIGKKLHLSSLLMIFIFGLIINNDKIITRFKLNRLIDLKTIPKIKHDFKIITGESAFLIRTFFFLVFGMSIDVGGLFDVRVIVIGTIIVILLYLIRFLNFRLLLKTDVFPEILLAPRGLITILLFYQIPMDIQIKELSIEILSFVIIVTGLIMMAALIFTPNIKPKEMTIIDIGLAPAEDDEETVIY
jgi:Kef-type K+ transport system membrane component KefB